jgi:tetratricopeptide (TPR) repeat protein
VLLRLVSESNRGFEAGFVLDEIEGQLSVVLFQVLRDVALWSTSSAAERAGLFAPSRMRRARMLGTTSLPAEIADPVRTLSRLPERPDNRDIHWVQTACGRIAEWASEQRALRTAMAFARAGALAASASGAAAATAGFTALQWSDFARAEIWLRRASALARHKDPITFALARTTLGDLYATRGDVMRARSAFIQAIRATRGELEALEIRAQAGIGLAHNATTRNAYQEAERAARVALRAFVGRHPEVAIVSRQLAERWLQQGKSAQALRLLKRVRHSHVPRADRVETLTLLARAAAVCSDRATLRHAWQSVIRIANQGSGAEVVHMLFNLVRAAGSAVPRQQAVLVVRDAASMARAIGRPELVEADLALRYLPSGSEQE